MNVSLSALKKKCIACGSAHFVTFYKSDRNFQLIDSEKLTFNQQLEGCYNCGLVRQHDNASYSDTNLNKYYASTPRTPLDLSTLGKQDKRRANAVQRLKFIKKQKAKGTLLETGFGDGVFLNEARKVYDCTGIDPSKGYNYVRKYLSANGIKTHGGNLNSFSSKIKFDLVCSFLVLEHVKNPLTFLKQLKARLKPNGVLVVEVPDIRRYKLFNTESMLTHEHVYHYTIETLQLVMAKLGLQLVDCTNKNVTYGFSLIAAFKIKSKKALALKTNGFEVLSTFADFIEMRDQYRLKMTEVLRTITGTAKTAGKKTAIYGTGFLFNFALESCGLNMEGVDYLYDDTKEKAGTSIGQLNIQPLSKIAEEKPDTVLVFSEMFFPLLEKHILAYTEKEKVNIVNVHQQSI